MCHRDVVGSLANLKCPAWTERYKQMRVMRWCVFLLMLLSLMGCKKRKWQKFEVKGGAFSISLPAKPKKETRKVKTKLGTFEVHMYTLSWGESTFLYSYADYPMLLVMFSKPKMMLEGAAKGSTKQFAGAKFLKKQLIKKEGVNGIVFEVEGKIKGIPARSSARVFLRKNRLVQTMVIHRKGYGGAYIKKFLDSLKWLPMKTKLKQKTIPKLKLGTNPVVRKPVSRKPVSRKPDVRKPVVKPNKR